MGRVGRVLAEWGLLGPCSLRCTENRIPGRYQRRACVGSGEVKCPKSIVEGVSDVMNGSRPGKYWFGALVSHLPLCLSYRYRLSGLSAAGSATPPWWGGHVRNSTFGRIRPIGWASDFHIAPCVSTRNAVPTCQNRSQGIVATYWGVLTPRKPRGFGLQKRAGRRAR